MTYTVLGTLYNRYVLQLRGFDQIPQFSIESMKYHAREAMDWIKDIMAAYNIGGAGSGLPYTSGRPQSTNPVSHHTQASEDLNINTSNNFVRPQPTFSRSASQPNTNPVSHHTQTRAETQQTQAFPNSPPPPPLPPKQSLPQFVPRRVDLGSRGPTKEEQEFFLDDEEEEGEELQQVKPPPSTSATTAPSNRGSIPNASVTSDPRGTNAADARSQDANKHAAGL